jgi:hypothetical protein
MQGELTYRSDKILIGEKIQTAKYEGKDKKVAERVADGGWNCRRDLMVDDSGSTGGRPICA